MTMKAKLLICLSALLGLAAVDAVRKDVGMPRAKFAIRVLNEQDDPMPNASVAVVFMDPITRQGTPQEGLTDENGIYNAEGSTDGAMGGMITKEGYYRSGWPKVNFMKIENGHWLPWGEVYTTHLRPVGNPVPMYAKRVQVEVPAVGSPCGYDMEKADWIGPYGKGTKSDLIFNVQREYVDRFNFKAECQVAFAQPLDGLVRMSSPAVGRYSSFRWERSAPEAGYAASHTIRFVNRDPRSGQKPELTFDMTKSREQGYFFRVRTIKQNGKIVAANYGKITGDIGIDPRDSKTCTILFTYYLNPTSLDRNMEWDPKHNLLSGLSREETPQEP